MSNEYDFDDGEDYGDDDDYGQISQDEDYYEEEKNQENFKIQQNNQPQFYDWKGIIDNILLKTINNDIKDLLDMTFDQSLTVFQHYNYNNQELQTHIFNDLDKVKEQNGLNFDEKQMTLKDLENQECPSCFGDEGNFSKLPCGHIFCNDCLQEYIQIKVKQNIVKFTCLEEECNYHIGYNVISQFMDQSQYQQKLAADLCQKSKEIIQCPGVDCKYMLHNNNFQFNYVECYCGHKFCCKCCKEVHQPAPCEMLESWKKQTDQDDLNIKWISANAKICPSCKKAVQRSLGCDYMHCAPPGGCGKSFCYVCEQILTEADHGAHAACRQRNVNDQVNDKEKTQSLLRKVNQYYDKYKVCEIVQEKAKEYLDQNGFIYREKLFKQLQIPLTQTQFIPDSLQELILSRDVLKYSHILSFHIKPNQKKTKELFEFYQLEYEKQTEILAMFFEINLNKFMAEVLFCEQNPNLSVQKLALLGPEFEKLRKQIITVSESVKKTKENMIDAVEQGQIFID